MPCDKLPFPPTSPDEEDAMNAPSSPTATYRNLDDFYPYYLSEHSNRTCRRLHFVGTTLGFVQGYAFAWVGHFFFEHNKPATFKYPWLSYLGDWRMWRDTLTGKIPF
jgi:hypothetical protein